MQTSGRFPVAGGAGARDRPQVGTPVEGLNLPWLCQPPIHSKAGRMFQKGSDKVVVHRWKMFPGPSPTF